jgi:hypothetical protein
VSDQVWPQMPPVSYVYDFGDDWKHDLVYEGWSPATCRCATRAASMVQMPALPRTAVASVVMKLSPGRNPNHPDHKEMRQWFGGPFNPEAFDPTLVRFDDPRRRWEAAFSE